MKMNTIYKFSFVCFVFLLMLTFSACNMPWEPRATETPQVSPPPTETSLTLQTSEPEAESLEPVLGSTMLWFDTSTFVYVPAGEFEMGKDEPQPSDHCTSERYANGFHLRSHPHMRDDRYADRVSASCQPAPDLGCPHACT